MNEDLPGMEFQSTDRQLNILKTIGTQYIFVDTNSKLQKELESNHYSNGKK